MKEKNRSNILILNVEGLRPEYLGPYGNDWIDTPHFNRLAVQGFVFDHCFAGGLDLRKQLTAIWSGCHPSQASKKEAAISRGAARWLAEWFRLAGWFTTLVSSSEAAVQHPGAVAFDEHRLVAPLRTVKKEEAQSFARDEIIENPQRLVAIGEPARDWSETRTAAFFSHLIEIIEAKDGPRFVWCQLTTLNSVWESPLEIRERFREPGDPPAWQGTNIPRAHFSRDTDPDVYLPFVQAYAAEIYVLDLCLGGLLEAIRQWPSENPWTLVLLSSCGLPLGEHGYLGHHRECFHAESLHVPLIFNFSDGIGEAQRSQALVYPHDALPTLIDRLSWEKQSSQSPLKTSDEAGAGTGVWISGRSLMPVIRGELESVRDRVFSVAESKCMGILTPAWFAQILLAKGSTLPENMGTPEDDENQRTLRRLKALSDGRDSVSTGQDTELEIFLSHIEISELRQLVRLFVKPDDRWEINEVADRCPRVAVQFLQMAADFLKMSDAKTGGEDAVEFCTLPPLGHDLAKGIEA
ncbi:MAG: sulfatase-like hydrolase/transferase [Thermogutta sp.]